MQAPQLLNTSLGYCTGMPGGTGMSALVKAFTGPAVTAGLLAQPLAFFPLTPLQLGSLTLPAHQPLTASGLGSQASLLFDETISCSQVGLGQVDWGQGKCCHVWPKAAIPASYVRLHMVATPSVCGSAATCTSNSLVVL